MTIDDEVGFVGSHGLNIRIFIVPPVAPTWTTHANQEEDETTLVQTRMQPTHRKKVILDDLIEKPTIVQIPCQEVEFLRNQICVVDLGHVRDHGHVIRWHSATQEAFDLTPLWSHEVPTAFSLFTDGSAHFIEDQWQAASAVVLIVHTDYGDRFGGFRCFDVAPTENYAATAPRSELTALLAAILWSIQLLEWTTKMSLVCPIHFAYDSIFAGNAFNGSWQAMTHLDLITIGRSLVQWIEVRYSTSPSWTHVPAPTGNAWNEAADAISWAAVHKWIPATTLKPVLDILSFDSKDVTSIQWLWYFEAAARGDPRTPPIVDHHFHVNIAQPLKAQPQATAHAMSQRASVPNATKERVPLELRCATANVLTLHPNKAESGSGCTARQEALIKDFALAGFHVIGVQETRSKQTGHTTVCDFHVLSASATATGVGGVQLWIAREWKGQDHSILIKHSDLKIVHATSQRLVVCLQHTSIKLVFVVGHAPTQKSDEATTRWWKNTSSSIPSRARNWPIIAMLDANARVGSIQSTSIGPHHAAEENLQGKCFHDWLLEEDLIVPQTLQACHLGDSDAWWRPTGAGARLDYIAISHSIFPNAVCASISEIDLTLVRPDHASVGATIPIAIQHVSSTSQRRPSHSTMTSHCLPTWNTDVHTHAAMVHDQIAACHQIVQTRPMRKQHLSAQSQELINWKKYHRRRQLQVCATKDAGILRACFNAWSKKQPANDHANWLKLVHHQLAMHESMYTRLCRLVVTAVRQDDKSFYQHLAEKKQDRLQQTRAFLACGDKLNMFSKQIQKRKSSLRCMGPDPAEEAAHYCQLEAGTPCDYAELLTTCHARQCANIDTAPLVIPLKDIPSRLEVERAGSKAKPHKAPGLDGLALDAF